MKHTLYILMLLFSISSHAQLGWTKSQLVNLKGQYTREGTEDGVKYITYTNVDDYLSESFFFLESTGQAYMEIFKNDISNMSSMIKANNRDYDKVGDMQWLDPKTQIHIKIKTANENGRQIMVMVFYYQK